ncbi:MAG TPA: type IV toxin-antitoxin system AbiEi family antitoxin domain-containing protein [Ktedonobacterales bacterium]|jgi:predicted transcriptional regulator of viral defense system
MGYTRSEQVLELAREVGILRARDLDRLGIAREHLSRLEQRGLLERIDRGLYMLSNAEVTEFHSLVEATGRVPHGVICLTSALAFHHLTTQAPREVWMAIDAKAYRPKSDVLPLRIVRFSGKALTYGIETHLIEGVRVRVYSPAKTVADCFKFRYKIGKDVAFEALRETWYARRATAHELRSAAEVCRVWQVMRPYLEALAA